MKENDQVENALFEINNDSFNHVSLHEVDEVSITILMDNFIDFLLTNSEHATRPSLIEDEKIRLLPPPIAEHGFSALIRIESMSIVMVNKTRLNMIAQINLVSTIHFSLIQVLAKMA